MKKQYIDIEFQEELSESLLHAISEAIDTLVDTFRFAGSNSPPRFDVQISGNVRYDVDHITWDDLSDVDKGAVLDFLVAVDGEGESYAREHYPPKFYEHPELLEVISSQQLSDYCLALPPGSYYDFEDRYGEEELDRLRNAHEKFGADLVDRARHGEDD